MHCCNRTTLTMDYGLPAIRHAGDACSERSWRNYEHVLGYGANSADKDRKIARTTQMKSLKSQKMRLH